MEIKVGALLQPSFARVEPEIDQASVVIFDVLAPSELAVYDDVAGSGIDCPASTCLALISFLARITAFLEAAL